MPSERDKRTRTTTTSPPSPGDAVRRDLEEFGLNGYEARVLLALLRSGSATAPELARSSRVPRTSVYPVLQELAGRGLAEQVPGKMAVWVSPGRDEVLDRLFLAETERLHMLEARLEQTRRSLERLGADNDTAALPDIHLLHGPIQAKRLYDRILAEATSEVVVMNLPPYSWPVGESNPAVIEALGRGVTIRALYQADSLVGPDAEAFRHGIEGFHEAGVEGRVVDEIPAKLVVADSAVALLGTPTRTDEYPAVLHVEDRGIARLQAAAFERWWASSRPYVAASPRPRRQRGAPSPT